MVPTIIDKKSECVVGHVEIALILNHLWSHCEQPLCAATARALDSARSSTGPYAASSRPGLRTAIPGAIRDLPIVIRSQVAYHCWYGYHPNRSHYPDCSRSFA